MYLKYNDPEQSLNNILGSLLKQLIQDQGSLSTAMSKLYESYGDLGMSPSSKDISEALLHSLGLYSEVFLIVDALDECSDDTRWGGEGACLLRAGWCWGGALLGGVSTLQLKSNSCTL